MRRYDRISFVRLTALLAVLPNTVLANYTYDALGRRIVFEDPVAAVTTRYYYDAQSVIEERNAADARLRFHVNGAQFIDERVTTFEESASEFTYYLVNQNFSIAGMGNADGSVIERLDYSSTGDFAGGGPGAASFYHDADDDLDLDLRDFASFQNCFGQTDPACLAVHDFDTVDPSDGDIDLDDYARFFECFRGPFVTPDQTCGILQRSGAPPPSGTFALHGRPVDILSDGHTLMSFRARSYDPVNGRWLQRDPKGFVDGSNLYESFGANPLFYTDPFGYAVDTAKVLQSLYASHPELKHRWELLAGAGWTFRFGNPVGWFSDWGLDWTNSAIVLTDTNSPQDAAVWLAGGINRFYRHNRGRYADYLIKAGLNDKEIIEGIMTRGGGVMTAEQKARFAHEVASINAATAQLRNQLKAVGLLAVAVVWEPADWTITVNGWRKGEFSYWDLAGLLPIIPATGGKSIRLLSESGDELALIGRNETRIEGKVVAVRGVIEKHHLLPRQFKKDFQRAGLNIEDFVIRIPKGAHRVRPAGLHTGRDNWNAQWRGFFDGTPNPSPQDILGELKRMKREFGLE